MSPARMIRLAAAIVLACAGCTIRPLTLLEIRDGGACDGSGCVTPDEGESEAEAEAEAEAESEGGSCDCPTASCVCGAPELCNGIDDNCDCSVDEGAQFVGQPCDPGDPNRQDPIDPSTLRGACAAGEFACADGRLVCRGGVPPTFESCDGIDNNCDGRIDEVFDFMNDPYHCGGCSPCMIEHAIAICVMGGCQIGACEMGYVRDDSGPTPSCYHCTPTGTEICDGIDNDCNRLIDAEDPGFVDLSTELGLCRNVGGCAGAHPVCTASALCPPSADPAVPPTCWQCAYPAGVDYDPRSGVFNESRCDGFDNNCDGQIDETFPGIGTPCQVRVGASVCPAEGTLGCNATQDGVVCVISSPPRTPRPESCNGIDDDCNGLIDDGPLTDGVDMTHVSWASPPFSVFTYEASHPDAGAVGDGVACDPAMDGACPGRTCVPAPAGARCASAGTSTARACSRPDVLPWSNLTWEQARDACAASGMHLCTAAEWDAACGGPSGLAYPYGDAYEADTCNGNDYDPIPGPPDDDAVLPTGSLSGCVSADGAYDLSGNVREWTDDPVSDGTPPDPDGYRARGGSMTNPSTGLACGFRFTVLPDTFEFANLGFRCCCTPSAGETCP